MIELNQTEFVWFLLNVLIDLQEFRVSNGQNETFSPNQDGVFSVASERLKQVRDTGRFRKGLLVDQLFAYSHNRIDASNSNQLSEKTMAKSYYEILEVGSQATEAEIRKAYRLKIREFHPDLNPDKVKASKRTRELNIALEVLTSPEKRKRYDEKLQRMGKEKANAEFDFTGKGDQAKDHDMPEFEFESSEESKAKNANSRPSKRKGMHPAWMVLSMATAGLSAVCVASMFLWVFFRLDPTGLIAAEPVVPKSDETANRQVELAMAEIRKLRVDLDKTNSRIDSARSSTSQGPSPSGKLSIQKATLKKHHEISSVGGPDNYEPIDLAIKPVAGKHLIIATIMGFSGAKTNTDIRAKIQSSDDSESSWFFLAFDQSQASAGTLTIPIFVETDGTKEFRVWASRGNAKQQSKIHQGSSLASVKLAD